VSKAKFVITAVSSGQSQSEVASRYRVSKGLGLERHYGLEAAARDVEAWQQHEWRLLSILDADYPDFSYVFPDPAARRRALRQFMVATARDAAI
jgi:hypothetical protein